MFKIGLFGNNPFHFGGQQPPQQQPPAQPAPGAGWGAPQTAPGGQPWLLPPQAPVTAPSGQPWLVPPANPVSLAPQGGGGGGGGGAAATAAAAVVGGPAAAVAQKAAQQSAEGEAALKTLAQQGSQVMQEGQIAQNNSRARASAFLRSLGGM